MYAYSEKWNKLDKSVMVVPQPYEQMFFAMLNFALSHSKLEPYITTSSFEHRH